MKLNQSTPSLRTWQTYEVKDLSQSCKICWRSGMMQSGTVFPLAPSALPTGVIGYGLLPTPVASEKGDCPSERRRQNPHLETFIKMLPTPTACDATVGNVIGKDDTYKMNRNGNVRKYTRNGTSGSLGLARHVKLLPTPTARDCKDLGSLEKLAQYYHKSRLGPTIAYEALHGEQSKLQD